MILKTLIVFSHFFYLPIILACIWWKKKGLIVPIFLTSLLILPPIFLELDTRDIDNLLRGVILLSIGIIATILSEQTTKIELNLKKSEEELRKLNKELEQRIEERTKKLKESEKRYRDFMSIASHEFKTPLIPIIGMPQLLLKDNNLTEQQKHSLNEILHSGKKLNKLIDNLLDTSQIERKSIELIKREIKINTLIDLCISDLSFLIKQKNHILIKNLKEDIKLNIDDRKISRVLTNLISNAIKYTPSNGKIEISTQIDDDNNFIFIIKDNGIGIEEKDQELIFQKFGKIRGEEIVKYELDSHGSGLGLFISKEIIKLHGGEIWFESEGKNQGTTFYFKLPRK